MNLIAWLAFFGGWAALGVAWLINRDLNCKSPIGRPCPGCPPSNHMPYPDPRQRVELAIPQPTMTRELPVAGIVLERVVEVWAAEEVRR